MAEQVEISLRISAEWHNDRPNYQVLLDDIELKSGRLEELKKNGEHLDIKWQGELDDGEHTIRLIVTGKHNRHTKIDADHNIIADQLVFIEELSIDQIELGHIVYKECNFYPDKIIHHDLPEVIPHLDCIGYNGEWQMKISVPTYIWLLEHF